MTNLFLAILNMSLTGAFVICIICLARLPLKKAPKIISYFLWVVAGLRLILPFSIESMFSLMPFSASPISTNLISQAIPTATPAQSNIINAYGGFISYGSSAITRHIPQAENSLNNALPSFPSIVEGIEPTVYAHSLFQNISWLTVVAFVWLTVSAGMLSHGFVSYIMLKRKMSNAICVESNVFESENISSPFVLGILSPKIYLPQGLSKQEHKYIILHEQTHIRRFDHIARITSYIILCLHWFNPLAWAAFILMGRDMEMACDEQVLKEMGNEIKTAYSMSLITLATERRFINAYPPAFGEGNIKGRVKNVIKFKKTSRIIIIAAAIFVVALGGILMIDRADADLNNIPTADSQLSRAEIERLGAELMDRNRQLMAAQSAEIEQSLNMVLDPFYLHLFPSLTTKGFRQLGGESLYHFSEEARQLVMDFLSQFPNIDSWGSSPNIINWDGTNFTNAHGVLHSTENGFAKHFTLFDLDDDGMPEVIITFVKYVDGIYMRNTIIYQYNNGTFQPIISSLPLYPLATTECSTCGKYILPNTPPGDYYTGLWPIFGRNREGQIGALIANSQQHNIMGHWHVTLIDGVINFEPTSWVIGHIASCGPRG